AGASLAFGALHAYQGSVGVARTGLLGAGLAGAVVVSGSLWPAIVAHTLIDLALGLGPARRVVDAFAGAGTAGPVEG
ncbi:MAG: CPBP family intramembrane metalloprotease, partial [Gemmatimonadetes bacterium]